MADRPDESDDPTPRIRADARRALNWLSEDDVLQLREWASETTHPLPAAGTEWIVGADPSVDLPLVDPTGGMSRRHARLYHDKGIWKIEDLRSTNGIQIDGRRPLKRRAPIRPGAEISLGGRTLVAENQTLIALRRYLARILGWGAANLESIDMAMRAVRAAASRRGYLMLAGPHDLVSIARQIHARPHLRRQTGHGLQICPDLPG